ncbi:MAG: MarR family winged helix-turn-helix transcriptional regulator [Bacteroidota bacterium]
MDEILKLLGFWKTYTEQGLGNNLSHFGLWLNNELTKTETEKIPDQFNISTNVKIGFLLGHIMAYGEVWIKLAFRDLPIQHFHDFGTLRFIQVHKNPTKKEIAEDSMMEQSSCFESLKRLTKAGLLIDQADKNDKRVKRVKLTKIGNQVLEAATKQSFALSDLLVGDLNPDEKEQLIRLLEKLGKFHEHLYQNSPKEKITQAFKL